MPLSKFTFLLKKNYQSIPDEVRFFLLRGFLFFILWQLIYQTLLFEGRIVDGPLTEFTAKTTGYFLEWLYPNHQFDASQMVYDLCEGDRCLETSALVTMNQVPLIRIADACNGLEMFVLFLGFILAYPSKWRLKVGFGILGMALLVSVNVMRCVVLSTIQIHLPHFTVFAHHYIFNVLTYITVFYLWYRYTILSKQ